MSLDERKATLDWVEEANAVMKDIERFVACINISQHYKSNCMRIFFEIETLEHERLIVCMSSRGFTICPENDDLTNDCCNHTKSNESENIYETINALLDDNSKCYRESFAQALCEKMESIKESRCGD